MASGRELKVYLTSDVSKFGRGLKGAEDRLTRFRRNAARTASAIGVGVAAGVAAAAVAITDAINSASDLNEAISKTNVIFGKSAAGLIKWADGADRAFGLSQKSALDVASTFGAIGKQAGMSEPKAAKFAQRLTKMAGDLASFGNTSVEDAARALASGLRGESEPLRAYNINLSEAAVNAKALDAGLVKAEKDTTKVKSAQLAAMRAQDAYNDAVKKHGAESKDAKEKSMAWQIAQEKLAKVMQGSVPKLTDAQKTVARTMLIFDQGRDAVGDYARTADGIANTVRTITSQVEDIKADFGTGLIEGFGAIDEAGQGAKDSLANMEDDAKRVGEAFGKLGAGALTWGSNFLLGLESISRSIDLWSLETIRNLTDVQDFLGLISDAEGQARNDRINKLITARNWTTGEIVSNGGDFGPNGNGGGGGSFTSGYQGPQGYDQYVPWRHRTRDHQKSKTADGRTAQKEAKTRTHG